MHKLVLAAVLAAAIVPSFAMAQNAAGSDATSSSLSGAQAGAVNAGVQVSNTFDNPGQLNYSGRYTVRSAPPVMLGGFGTSFSSDNCVNIQQAGVSVLGAGIAAGGGKVDQNCAHIRRGYAFGQAAAYAAKSGQAKMASQLLSMANWEFCTSDADTQKACLQAGLVVPAGDKAAPSTGGAP